MDIKSAAIRVLPQNGAALSAKEISERIIAAGLWRSAGKTPAASVGARLYCDIRDNGDTSPFVQVAPRRFALRACAETLPPAAGETPPQPAAAASGLSFTDCACKVLEAFAGGQPMHYRAITAKALEQGWLVTTGKTPQATMYALIISEIKRLRKRGERPRFVQHGRGYVGLEQWLERGLASRIARHNHQVRKTLRERLLAMTAGAFEELIAGLLVEMGFERVEGTRLSGDGGIDVRGTLLIGDVVRIKMAVQVKKWKPGHNIQAPVVQQVRGSLGAHEHGLIITTSDFSAGAAREAAESDKTPIALMNGTQLVLLLTEHGIGVKRSSPDLLELDAAFSPDEAVQ